MKLIYDAANSLEAHMILNLLEQAGLSARIDGELLQGGIGDLQAFGIVRVMVEDEDYDLAKVIVDDWDASQPADVATAAVAIKTGTGSTSKVVLGSVLIALIAFAYWYGFKSGQMPEVIYQAPVDDPNLVQWRKNWREAGDSIVSASVLGNASDQLFVYVNYIYSGEHGDNATACGAISRLGRGGHWTCSPVEVGKGRGYVTLRFALNEWVQSVKCSDSISISFYDRQGRIFFEKTVPYRKTWIRGAEGALGKVKEVFTSCPLA